MLEIEDEDQSGDDIPVVECRCSNDMSLWVDEPDLKRFDWIRTTCGMCGKWLGYRTKESNNEASSKNKKR